MIAFALYLNLKDFGRFAELTGNACVCGLLSKFYRVADQVVANLCDPLLVSNDLERNVNELIQHEFGFPSFCIDEVGVDDIFH